MSYFMSARTFSSPKTDKSTMGKFWSMRTTSECVCVRVRVRVTVRVRVRVRIRVRVRMTVEVSAWSGSVDQL